MGRRKAAFLGGIQSIANAFDFCHAHLFFPQRFAHHFAVGCVLTG